MWRAVDETLERQVSLRLLPTGHPHAADVVDAARRAALVDDPRLCRVLDVGDRGDLAYIVSEHAEGRSLAEVLREGPLPPATARRIVGEAAQALDRAGARGLHHLRLGPSSIVVLANGSVKVLGTAVEAASGGQEEDDAEVASRVDTMGLVRLLYAGLTGRWPGPEDGPLPMAQRVQGRPVPPAELAPGVPNDLDTLCSVTLGPHDDGPRTPAELVEQLSPWDDAAPLTTGPDEATATPSGEIVTLRPLPMAGSGSQPDPATSGTTPVPSTVPQVHATTVPWSAPPPDPATRSAAPAPAPAPALAPRRSGDPAGDPGGPAGQPLDRADVRPGLQQLAPAPPPQLSADGLPVIDQNQNNARSTGWGARWGRGDDDDERLGPFMPPVPIGPPPPNQAKIVIFALVGLLVVGLVFSIFVLRAWFTAPPLIPTPSNSPPGAAAGSRSGSTTPPAPSPSQDGQPSPSSSPSPSAPEIAGVRAIDPQGDGSEYNSSAARVIDGDPGTTWRSERYQEQDFGGKDGVGLVVDLGEPSAVSQVTVEFSGTGGQLEVRSNTTPDFAGSTLVQDVELSGGEVTVRPSAALTTRYLVLWFTRATRQSDGDYRLLVSEVSVR